MSWIFFTIAASILQTFRNLEQKSLNKKLDDITVSWSRFILPLPLSLVVMFFTFSTINNQFILYCVITAIAQISGNVFLLKTIKSRNFSIGIAFFKTEVLQTMLIGLLVFGQAISNIGFVAVLMTSFGMILMSNSQLKDNSKIDKSALFGAASGLFFAISAFSLKFAAEELLGLGYSNLKASSAVLLWVIAFQNLLFVIIKSAQKNLIQDLKKLFSLENKTSFLKTGLLSFAGSLCWFTAYTIGNVVYVKVVGQIELILAVIVSHSHLKEKHGAREIAGIVLTAIGILILTIFH
jgi:drug/metabolite transporter (DMT)-like permease